MSSMEGSYFFQKCLHGILFLQSLLDELVFKKSWFMGFSFECFMDISSFFIEVFSGENFKVVFKS